MRNKEIRCEECGHKKEWHCLGTGTCNKYIKKDKAIFECTCKRFHEPTGSPAQSREAVGELGTTASGEIL